jgi:anti-sigma-K factor RskA
MKQEIESEFEDVLNALDAWEAEPAPLDFDRRLYARLNERRSAVQRLQGWLGGVRWQPAMPAAAVVAAYALLMAYTPQSTVQERAAPHVEQALDDLDMLQQLPILEG